MDAAARAALERTGPVSEVLTGSLSGQGPSGVCLLHGAYPCVLCGIGAPTPAEIARVNLPTVWPAQFGEPDSELVALGKCIEALKALDVDQSNRVCNNLLHRFVTIPMARRVDAQQKEAQEREERLAQIRLIKGTEVKS